MRRRGREKRHPAARGDQQTTGGACQVARRHGEGQPRRAPLQIRERKRVHAAFAGQPDPFFVDRHGAQFAHTQHDPTWLAFAIRDVPQTARHREHDAAPHARRRVELPPARLDPAQAERGLCNADPPEGARRRDPDLGPQCAHRVDRRRRQRDVALKARLTGAADEESGLRGHPRALRRVERDRVHAATHTQRERLRLRRARGPLVEPGGGRDERRCRRRRQIAHPTPRQHQRPAARTLPVQAALGPQQHALGVLSDRGRGSRRRGGQPGRRREQPERQCGHTARAEQRVCRRRRARARSDRGQGAAM